MMRKKNQNNFELIACLQIYATSKLFELRCCDWADLLRLFQFFSNYSNFLHLLARELRNKQK
jgi:hypothetical protein